MKVLVIEDDHELAETIRADLSAHNNTVEVVENGADGSFLGRTFDYDAIILDNSLPKKND
jgi:two-component system OmpR family response regulator